MTTTISPHGYDLTATNAVWIGLSTLHASHPDAEGFTKEEIENEIRRMNLFQKNPSTITTHITNHLAANKSANAKPRRMVTQLPGGQLRLFIEGDPYHSSRLNGPVHPSLEDLPLEFRPLLRWYEAWSHQHRKKRLTSQGKDPMEMLEGTWTFGESDTFLGEMRRSWEMRS